LLSGFRWFDNPRFMGAAGAQRGRWMQIDFMRRRYLWFAISGLVVVISAVSLAARGLNLGIDFRGGVQISFTTPAPTSLTKVRAQAADIGRKDAVVQGKGTVTGSDSYKTFQIRLKKLQPAEQAKLTTDLNDRLNAQKLGVKNVSSSFGRQIARSAIIAILFSLFLIVLYAWIRFDLKFAVPVIVAMLHDVLITVGVYSLTGREVTSATVAAVLTVGIASGAYSSIFIAAPLLTIWKEREPEFARRREVPLDGIEGRKVLRQAELAAAAEPTPETPMDVVEDAVEALTDGDEDAKR